MLHRLVVALVTLFGLTGAFVVGLFLLLSGVATDRAASLAPATTIAYASVYLQPSAGQQMNLAELIGRLPGFADDASLDEKVDQVAQNLLAGTGIDYREDLKPWLGGQLAVAAWTDEGETIDAPSLVVIAEVRDPDAAAAAVPRLLGGTFERESHEGAELFVGDSGAYAFVEEMLVTAPDPADVRAALDANRGASLADRAEFRTTLDGLAADHLASAFVDVAALGGAAGGDLEGLSTLGAVIVAAEDGIQLVGGAPYEAMAADPTARAAFDLGTEPATLAEWMPDGTVAAATVIGLRGSLEDAEALLGATPDGEELAGLLSTARALAALGFGINLDTDVLPLLDREVGVALTGLDGDRPSGQLILRPSDDVDAAALLDGLVDRLEEAGATRTTETLDDPAGVEVTLLALPEIGQVAYAVEDGVAILGFEAAHVAAAISAHRSGDTLGATDAYRSAFEVAGGRAGTEAWADVPALAELIGMDASLPGDARDILARIGSFALTLASRDDLIEFRAALTVDDRQPE